MKNFYSNMSVSQLRKSLSQRLNAVTIKQEGYNPAPSKTIRCMNKLDLVNCLTTGIINWDELRSSSAKAPTPKGDPGELYSSKADPNAKEDLAPEGSSSNKSEPNKSEPNKSIIRFNPLPTPKPLKVDPIADRKYVTDKGVINIEDVAKDLGLPQLANGINDLFSSGAKSHNDLVNKVNNLKIEGGSGAIEVIVDNKKPQKIEGHTHPQFKKILNYAVWHKNVFLVGEAGTGKTTVAGQVAKALDLDFAHLSCSGGMSEAHILGRMLFDGSYVESDFVRIYENGGVFLLDEFDAMDGNTAVVINSALANGVMSVPNRKDKPTANRHDDCIIIASANTWGNGFGSNTYAGRNRLDGATLDRFACSKVSFGYDKSLERKLSGQYTDLADTLWLLRKRVSEFSLNRVISTRLFIGGNKALTCGESVKDYLDTITIDWTREERLKVDIKNIYNDANQGAK